MKKSALAAMSGLFAMSGLALAGITASPALAAGATPAGEWRVADGQATVRIDKCGAYYCGFVATARTPGKDIRNPDPSKRGRNVIGMQIMYNLKSDGAGSFTGETYNADDGQIYIGTLTPQGETMSIKGCVPHGGICGSETWTLVHK